jgi:uncharacterized protein YukE
MAFMGMNPAQMRSFETSLTAEAKRVKAVIADLDGRVAKVDWRGPDAKKFKGSTWPSARGQLDKLVAGYEQLREAAQAQRVQQERTSAS